MRRNIFLGLALVVAAVALLLRALDVIPESLFDTIFRAYPILLVLFGLSVLLRQRIPLSGLISFILCIVLTAGVVAVSFSSRAGQTRTDYQQPILQQVSESTQLLNVVVNTLTTDVDFLPLETDDLILQGEFVGSTENFIEVTYEEDEAGVATLTLTEQMPNQFPRLDAVGRGRLNLQFPAGLPTFVTLNLHQGDTAVDFTGVDLERLILDVQQGDALVTLPAYQPQSPQVQEEPGTLTVREGGITVLTPEIVGAQFILERANSGIEPQFDDDVYRYLQGDVLESRNYEDAELVIDYLITAPRSVIRAEVVPAVGSSTSPAEDTTEADAGDEAE